MRCEMRKEIAGAAATILAATDPAMGPREVGIILGSGLSELGDQVEGAMVVAYGAIPGFGRPAVEGHRGRLVVGRLEGMPVAVLEGRFHYYEGYSMAQATFPVRVLAALGMRMLIQTNASGGMNPDFRPGDIMLITDHINCMGDNPLRGPNDAELGPRFPDMNGAYDPGLAALARKVAVATGLPLREGVYVGVGGPTYETPAELGLYRTAGGDAVGMSTVPETIVARHMGVRVLGLSCVTNRALAPFDRAREAVARGAATGAAGAEAKVSHQEVLDVAAASAGRLIRLVRGILRELAAEGRRQNPAGGPRTEGGGRCG
jgi:purine-nucleoside phosphorylase